MFHTAKLYYFSPTGGTKRSGEIFCKEISQKVTLIDLGAKGDFAAQNEEAQGEEDDLAVFAVPVFGGRIPGIAAEKLNRLNGGGKEAVTMVVYGNRAYEDALLELNNIIKDRGFHIAASCACVAQHSMAPEVGKGRPDEADGIGIRDFAKKAAEKIAGGAGGEIVVPGNYPYRDGANLPVTPISLPDCTLCGECAASCPVDAIAVEENAVVTNPEKCILCMACAAACPKKARILPPPMEEKMEQLLGALKTVRRENEYFL